MGTYDFNTQLIRSGQGSIKWDLASQLHAGPLDAEAVPLSIADMEFVMPPELKDSLKDYLDNAVLGYTGPTQEFFDAVQSWQKRRHAWTLEQEWIVLSPGVVAALYNAVRSFTKPGEGVIIQQPVYYPFVSAVEDSGRMLLINELVRDAHGCYTMDFEGLERLASRDECKLLILCSPHNPVGRVWTDAELRRLIDICLAHNITIVADEIHGDLIMPAHQHHSLMTLMTAEERRSCIVCIAPTKTFNLAGCQCSCIVIPDAQKRTHFAQGFREIGIGTLNAFAYPATIAAYTQLEPWLDQLIDHIWDNWQFASSYIQTHCPQAQSSPLEGTYLQWTDFSWLGLTDNELDALMHKHQLYLDAGSLFGRGGSGFERINLAAPQSVIHEAAERIVMACQSVR